MADPALPLPLTTEARAARRIRELERRVDVLERGAPAVQSIAGAGAPPVAARDGVLAVAPGRLWVREAGGWHWVLFDG